jgi:hypothetical protein
LEIEDFEYHTYIGLIDKDITPPIRDKDLIDEPYDDPYWEAKGYKWIDPQDLIQSAEAYQKGDTSKFEKLMGKKGSKLHGAFAQTLILPKVKKKLKKYQNSCNIK